MNLNWKWVGSAVLLLSLPLLAIGEETKAWKETAEFSLVSTNGNSKGTTMSGKSLFTYDWKKWAFELFAGGLGADSDGETTAEQYHVGEKLGYKISKHNYFFEKYRWDKDRFSGIDSRHDTSLGYGREIYKSPLHHVIGEAGGGYTVEDRRGEKNNDFVSGQIYSKYIYKFSPTAQISQDGEYIHNFDDKEDYRLKTETALSSTLNSHLSLKVAYTLRRAGDPPAGFKKTDTTTTVALIVNY